MAAVVAGDAAGIAAGATLSSGAVEALVDVGGASGGVRGHWPDLWWVGGDVGVVAESLAISPGPEPFRELWVHKFSGGLLADLILYGVILLAGHLLDSQEKLALQQAETARLNEQLSKAQLDALRRQIEPHFLFNTLNAIAGLVREQRNDAAVSMIAGLSDFLRRVVDDSGRQQVPLGEELEFTQKYLEFERHALRRGSSSAWMFRRNFFGAGSELDPAANGGERGQTWDRQAGAWRSNSHCGVALERHTYVAGV